MRGLEINGNTDMNMAAKREYVVVMRKRYKTCRTKVEKSEVIEELQRVLKVHRKSAIRILNGKQRRGKRLCVHPYTYGLDLIAPLQLMWEILGRPCSKRLQPEIPNLLKQLQKFGEIRLYGDQESQLKKMSNWTINQLLHDERERLRGTGISGTRKSPLLKTLIPIRTGWEDVKTVGHLEIDCVLHCGESLSGTYAETVNMIDIETHWNEKRMIFDKNKGKVVGAIHEARKQFPFPVQSIDFDNGKEFVNWNLHGYCTREGIAFTRSRSYHKNDQAHIEGKNYQSVRRVVGYGRIVDQTLIALFNDMYENEHRLLTNFFYPTMKLKSKKRTNAKISKTYEVATTPYQRIVECKDISQEIKDRLTTQYEQLNPMKLHQSLQKKLTKIKQLQAISSVTISNLATSPNFF